jgi:hypothetical protein
MSENESLMLVRVMQQALVLALRPPAGRACRRRVHGWLVRPTRRAGWTAHLEATAKWRQR